MDRTSLGILTVVLCLGLVMGRCPKKAVVKEEPSVKKGEEVGRLEAEHTPASQTSAEHLTGVSLLYVSGMS
jgi:hypothetical protein